MMAIKSLYARYTCIWLHLIMYLYLTCIMPSITGSTLLSIAYSSPFLSLSSLLSFLSPSLSFYLSISLIISPSLILSLILSFSLIFFFLFTQRCMCVLFCLIKIHTNAQNRTSSRLYGMPKIPCFMSNVCRWN